MNGSCIQSQKKKKIKKMSCSTKGGFQRWIGVGGRMDVFSQFLA